MQEQELVEEAIEEEMYNNALKNIETQKEVQEEVYDDTPSYNTKEDLISLFWKVISKKDSSKIAYLDKNELGNLDISVRDAQNIANICEVLKRRGVATYLRNQGEIILSTSLSKKGFLLDLFITTKKLSIREKRSLDDNETKQKESFLLPWKK